MEMTAPGLAANVCWPPCPVVARVRIVAAGEASSSGCSAPRAEIGSAPGTGHSGGISISERTARAPMTAVAAGAGLCSSHAGQPVMEEEADHFAARVGPGRIRIGSRGAATGPRMPQAVQPPDLENRPVILIHLHGSPIADSALRRP